MYHTNKEIKYKIMSNSLYIQNQMNNALANRSYKKAIKLYVYMNELREQEGMEKLTLPNLEKRMSN